MNKKFGIVSLLAVLALSIALNVTVASDAYAVESDTPCTDRWAGCTGSGASTDYCDGQWCGCMYARYGYVCTADDYQS